MNYKQDNLFGWNDEAEEAKASLFDKFIIPPFSVLDRRQGYWQNRKRTWLRLGIKSELGRDEHLCFNLNSFDADTDKAVRQGQAQADAPSTSVFDPVLCELAYTWVCPKGGSILDPFCGGSVRGIVACQLGYKYTGIDLRAEQIQENIKQAKEILGDEGTSALTYITGDSDGVLCCMHCKAMYTTSHSLARLTSIWKCIATTRRTLATWIGTGSRMLTLASWARRADFLGKTLSSASS